MKLATWIKTYFELRTDLADASDRDQRTTAAMLLRYFGPGRDIDAITRLDAAKWRAGLSGSDATARKHTRNARTLFGLRHGATKFDLCKLNPFDREPSAPRQPDQDWHYLGLDEFERLFQACRPELGLLIALARLAGLRLNEAKRLTWADVSLTDRRITVTPATRTVTTKQKRRVVPICPRLARLLAASRAAGELVADFGRYQDALRPLRRAISAAGLPQWASPFHTLRKNCETDWLAAGLPVMDVCRWLGHDPRVAATYYHQTTSETWARITRDEDDDEDQRPDDGHSPEPRSGVPLLRLAQPGPGQDRQDDPPPGRQPGGKGGGPQAQPSFTLVG